MNMQDVSELAYKNGYQKGMEDAVKQGLAHTVKEPNTEDLIRMLMVIHEENICIISNQLVSIGIKPEETSKYIEPYKKAFRGEISEKELDTE